MTTPKQRNRATLNTYLLSAALASSAASVAVFGSTDAPIATALPASVVMTGLAVAFLLGEQLLMNVEFRRQAYSMTLGGIPLVIGLLFAPLHYVVVARLIGAGAALM